MRSPWARQRDISAAARGHIIQRILVDGWTTAEAAAHLAIEERRIRRWLAVYRRRGLASLRGDFSAETLPQRCAAWLRSCLSRMAVMARADAAIPAPAICVELHRSDDKRKRV